MPPRWIDPPLDFLDPLAKLLPFGPARRFGFLEQPGMFQEQADRLLATDQLGVQALDLPDSFFRGHKAFEIRRGLGPLPNTDSSRRRELGFEPGDLLLEQGDRVEGVEIRR